MEENGLIHALTAPENEALQEKLLALLARRSHLYTMDDSSSIRVETAQALLASIRFLLTLQLRESGKTERDLLHADAEGVLMQGIKTAARKTDEAQRLYGALCAHLPDVENEFMTDTLREIGLFFKRYDVRYFAHQMPCAIDYPLCLPVPETMQGVDYIAEYLQRLAIENHILRQYSTPEAVRLLKLAYPDYRGLPLNLFEPIMQHAVGKRLRKDDEKALHGLSPAALDTALRRAGAWMADGFCPDLPQARSYVAEAAANFGPYLHRMLALGVTNGVFFTP